LAAWRRHEYWIGEFMNVGDLKKLLEQYPDDMEILYCCCSDYEILKWDDIKKISSVDQGGYWMRSHATMSAENKSKEKTCLLFPGN
jgi:hypothetical protein